MSVVEQNSVVSVMYTGTFPDSGEVFDTNVNQPPLVFLVGHGNIIEGFEQEILGAAVGDVREFTLTPEMAYGHRDEAAVQPIPRSQFPEGMELEVGRVVGAQSDQGPVQFTVVEINDDIVIVDLNHQMAGYTLHFSVEIVEIREATSEELEHGHAHGPGHHHH
ncbi:MAG TPA: peptidylprolyl isomerase [Candidatus Thalassarchaeum sp.]|jgi:FKBP-type peptidyl-prolyl cis-trans isomerase SlyD|nr:peptidylprolyl isomerase [Candidatus Thalassarchaeum sp.]|tara:strand:- start:143 stop:631 length:489 start_codon:yes stop_codon:yes gene_type:complete